MKIELDTGDFTVDNKTIRNALIIEDKEISICNSSYAFGLIETTKATITKQIEELKLEYKIWLSDKKKEVDRKVYNTELAKEDAVIAKYRTEYLQYNKKIIDLTYQQNILNGLAKAHEMKTNLLIALLTNKKDEKENAKKVEEWNKKVENTKI